VTIAALTRLNREYAVRMQLIDVTRNLRVKTRKNGLLPPPMPGIAVGLVGV
jgi:hypothetical protein